MAEIKRGREFFSFELKKIDGVSKSGLVLLPKKFLGQGTVAAGEEVLTLNWHLRLPTDNGDDSLYEVEITADFRNGLREVIYCNPALSLIVDAVNNVSRNQAILPDSGWEVPTQPQLEELGKLFLFVGSDDIEFVTLENLENQGKMPSGWYVSFFLAKNINGNVSVARLRFDSYEDGLAYLTVTDTVANQLNTQATEIGSVFNIGATTLIALLE